MNETGLRYLLSLERMEGCLPPECAYIDSSRPPLPRPVALFPAGHPFLVGENGSGKSTLLEAIAANYGLNPEGGSANFHFSTQSTHSALYRAIRLGKSPSRPQDAFSCARKAFTTSPARSTGWKRNSPACWTLMGEYRYMGNPTGKAFSPWCSIASAGARPLSAG